MLDNVTKEKTRAELRAKAKDTIEKQCKAIYSWNYLKPNNKEDVKSPLTVKQFEALAQHYAPSEHFVQQY